MTRVVVRSAGPLVSFQDAGRPGNMRFGVPASGPMDRLAHAAGNLAIGNPADATAVEVSIGGVTLEVASGAVTVAVTGGDAVVDRNGVRLPSWHAFTITEGDRVSVRPGPRGSWAYLAVCGHVDVPSWLGHTATHSMSGFGGGALHAGDEFEVTDARVVADREGEIPPPPVGRPDDRVRVVIGPQDRHFDDDAVTSFTTSPYVLTNAYDRMGVRLDGPTLTLRQALSIPSEPIVRGSVQVTGDGVPAVLLADHQTTGGYPKIATVISADLDRFAQRRAGDAVRFGAVGSADAVDLVRAQARLVTEYLQSVAGEGRTLTHRLRRENLISDAAPLPND